MVIRRASARLFVLKKAYKLKFDILQKFDIITVPIYGNSVRARREHGNYDQTFELACL